MRRHGQPLKFHGTRNTRVRLRLSETSVWCVWRVRSVRSVRSAECAECAECGVRSAVWCVWCVWCVCMVCVVCVWCVCVWCVCGVCGVWCVVCVWCVWCVWCVCVVCVVRMINVTACLSRRVRVMHLIRVAEHLGASSRRPRHPFPALMAGEPWPCTCVHGPKKASHHNMSCNCGEIRSVLHVRTP